MAAAIIRCIMAWLFTDAVIPAAARNGASPGAMFTDSSSIAVASAIIWSTTASEALSVLRFARAEVSGASIAHDTIERNRVRQLSARHIHPHQRGEEAAVLGDQ